MSLLTRTIKAHEKHLKVKIDKDLCVWKNGILLFSNSIVEDKQEEFLFNFLEGMSAVYDNKNLFEG